MLFRYIGFGFAVVQKLEKLESEEMKNAKFTRGESSLDSAVDMAPFHKFADLLLEQSVCGVGVVLSVDTLRSQLLEIAGNLRRRRDGDLDGIQSIFGPSHSGKEADKNGVFIG